MLCCSMIRAVGAPIAYPVTGPLAVGRTVTAIVEGDVVPQIFIPRLLRLWRQGRFPFDRLITTFGLDQINEAEKAAISGDIIKPVLLPGL
jgi:aryl-alcohol dehydrogenase